MFMKKLAILFTSFLLLVACNEPALTKYVPFASLDTIVDVPFFKKCLQEVRVKFFIRDNIVYVDDDYQAMASCS
jgi:hypothetical protein